MPDRTLTLTTKQTSAYSNNQVTLPSMNKTGSLFSDRKSKNEKVISFEGYSPRADLLYGMTSPSDMRFESPAKLCPTELSKFRR